MLRSSVRTYIIVPMIISSTSCGDRLSSPSCPQKAVDDNKSPIPQVTYANDTEILANKDFSGGSTDERDTFSAELAEKTTADDIYGISDTGDTGFASAAESGDSDKLPNTTPQVYHLSKGLILLIDNKQASIIDKNNRILCKNETLIRLQDENGYCFSDGFLSVKVVNGGFVLVQQHCGGRFVIMETSEFRYSLREDALYLKRFVLEYVDKYTDEHESKFYRITSKDFGKIRFEQIDWKHLYTIAWNKAEDNGSIK